MAIDSGMPMSRRELFGLTLAAGLARNASPLFRAVQSDVPSRRIPSTGEMLHPVGLGSWITFNVGDDRAARAGCAQVIRAFLDGGGRMIDSSPMYGSSQSVIGEALASLPNPQRAFSADKVWTSRADGRGQIEETRRHWRLPKLDLVQVHNLLGWEEHLPLLFEMKRAGRIRYVGITTSEGRRHTDLQKLLRQHPLDFVQLTYNPVDREVEQRLLPLAGDRGVAVIVNRPFQQGSLVNRLRRHALPTWARDIDCTTWAQVILKFIVSHPAVTCADPGDQQRGTRPREPRRRKWPDA